MQIYEAAVHTVANRWRLHWNFWQNVQSLSWNKQWIHFYQQHCGLDSLFKYFTCLSTLFHTPTSAPPRLCRLCPDLGFLAAVTTKVLAVNEPISRNHKFIVLVTKWVVLMADFCTALEWLESRRVYKCNMVWCLFWVREVISGRC